MAPSVTGVFAFLKHCGVLASGFATDADVKQAVTSWLPTLDTVILRPDTSYIATVGKMLKCQWLLRGSPMCSFCCPCATYTQKSEKRSWRQSFFTSFFTFWGLYIWYNTFESNTDKLGMMTVQPLHDYQIVLITPIVVWPIPTEATNICHISFIAVLNCSLLNLLEMVTSDDKCRINKNLHLYSHCHTNWLNETIIPSNDIKIIHTSFCPEFCSRFSSN